MSDYLIEKFSTREFDELIPLMKDCFGLDVDIEYFKWKYLDNPAGEVIAFIARDNRGKLAAYYGVIPEEYFIDGERTTIFQSCDTMTHSRHRRKGFFAELANRTYEYLSENNMLFVFGFAGEISIHGFLKFGWKQVFEIPNYFRTRQQIQLSKLFRGPINCIKKMQPILLSKLFRGFNRNSNFIAKEIEDPSEIMPLVNNDANHKRIQKTKDEKFIKWRLSNPRVDYRILGLFDKPATLFGYLIYYFARNDVYLFDAVVADEGRTSESLLFGALDNIVLTHKCRAIITLSQENTIYSSLLRRNGFIRNRLGYGPLSERIPFILYADEARLKTLNDPRCWAIKPLDHDAY